MIKIHRSLRFFKTFIEKGIKKIFIDYFTKKDREAVQIITDIYDQEKVFQEVINNTKIEAKNEARSTMAELLIKELGLSFEEAIKLVKEGIPLD